MIVLFPQSPDAPEFPRDKPSRVLHHLAFAVNPDRYEELGEICRTYGLEVREGVHPVLKNVRTFYVDDPEGNEVEVIARGGARISSHAGTKTLRMESRICGRRRGI